SDDSTDDGSTDDSSSDDSTDDGSTDDSSSDDSTETPLGGGAGYPNTVDRSQADFVVRNLSELESALSSASSGEIVFVTGDSEIDLGNGGFQVPSGVTLASNRGVDDAPGALLYTDVDADECIHLHGDARFTGIRLRGAHPGDDTSGDGSADGVETRGANEVDNCDIYGFTHGGIKVETGGDAHIHHNVIRECNRGGYGYGVTVESGHPLIEYNYFNNNRHSVATAGENPGYEVRYNHFGPKITDTPIDAHEPAGVNYEIHHNVVEGYVPYQGRFEGDENQAVQIRDVPDDVAYIHDNWFWNPNPPKPGTWGGSESPAIIQPSVSDWENVEFDGNEYGESANVSYSDVIPGHDG
ncbi:MAG: right-handed parallel beta-helix repeat-containing protein, partial [Halodesulfurarchaeum sp.]